VALLSALLGSWLLRPSPVWAHVGPPYAVLTEHPVGPYTVSLMADPDVGVGTFLVEVTLKGGEPAAPETRVGIWVRPQKETGAEWNGRQAQWEVTREGERFVGKVPFGSKGVWDVRLELDGPAGQGEVRFDVEVTPPYPGLLTTLVCLSPFMILGALWVIGTLRARRAPEETTLPSPKENEKLTKRKAFLLPFPAGD